MLSFGIWWTARNDKEYSVQLGWIILFVISCANSLIDTGVLMDHRYIYLYVEFMSFIDKTEKQ